MLTAMQGEQRRLQAVKDGKKPPPRKDLVIEHPVPDPRAQGVNWYLGKANATGKAADIRTSSCSLPSSGAPCEVLTLGTSSYSLPAFIPFPKILSFLFLLSPFMRRRGLRNPSVRRLLWLKDGMKSEGKRIKGGRKERESDERRPPLALRRIAPPERER